MRSESIKIDYPGSCISVNHYLGRRKDGGSYIKADAKDWIEQFQWLLKRCHLDDFTLPLVVSCSGFFKSEKNAPDLSNLSKVILDSIEGITGINDKNMRWHDGDRIIDVKGSPYLLINISEQVQDMPCNAPQSKSTGVNGESNGRHQRRRK